MMSFNLNRRLPRVPILIQVIRSSLLSARLELQFFYAITVLREISPRKPALAARSRYSARR